MGENSGQRPRFNLYHIFKADQKNNPMPHLQAGKLRSLIHALLTRR